MKAILLLQLFKESVVMAYQALILHKLRTTLSILGISIGIFSIIAVRTMVDSMENNLMQSFKSMGKDVLYIQKWPWTFGSDYPWWKYMSRPTPTLREMNELNERLNQHPQVDEIAFLSRFGNKEIKADGISISNLRGIAVTNEYPKINELNILEGRYFSERESAVGDPVIVLGHEIARVLFGVENALNKRVIIYGRKLKVVGVLERKGKSILGESEDNTVVIPLMFLKKVTGNQGFGEPSLLVKAADGTSVDELEPVVRSAMRGLRRLKPTTDDNFALNRITMLTTMINSVFGVLNVAGMLIGFFSVVVGGFGIANIMFVSVKERTNIIGIQKALGARNSFILIQFLSEAVALSIMGGLAGMALVGAIAIGVNFTMEDFTLVFSLKNFMIGNIISFIIGILAGIIPALFASRLKPVDAIRSKV